MKKLRLFICALCAALAIHFSQAQTLSDAERQKTVEAVARLISERYTFPDVAEKMASQLKENLASGSYATIDELPALALRLTQDLRDISHDKHLRINFHPEGLRPGQRAAEPTPAERADGPALGIFVKFRSPMAHALLSHGVCGKRLVTRPSSI